jgi:catechol 2,3-dioxygenase
MSMTVDAGAAIGGVHLRVSDLERSLAFYEGVLGLELQRRGDGRAALGAAGRTLVSLRELASAVPRPRRSTGLYHTAILFPNRLSLGRALARIVAARWPLQGASDHGVSEAIYLGDPDGLGIEVYRDRPGRDWPRDRDGLAMVSDPLDLRALVDEAVAAGEIPAGVPADTRVGHVHLQVRDIAEAEAFYHGVLGFDVMQRMVPSALFVSAGGYHHHVGLNTWGVAGAPPAPELSPGLDYFDLTLPGNAALQDARAALQKRDIALEAAGGGWLARDPSANAVRLVAG